VNQGTEWDVFEWKCVAGQNVCLSTAFNLLSNSEVLWSQDVCFFTIGVVKERDSAGSVRIVFDSGYRCNHSILLSLEVNDSVATLVTAATICHGQSTVAVSTARLSQRSRQTFLWLTFGDFRVG